MQVVFDPEKDAENVAKHGISLTRAEVLNVRSFVDSGPDVYGGRRVRAYGLLDGPFHVLVFTTRNGVVRAISLRRSKRKEYRHHVPD